MPDLPGGALSSVVRAVSDVGQACAFYSDVLGFPLQFRDGDRWAQLTAGGMTLALAGPGEAEPRATGVSMEVSDVTSTVDAIVAAGGHVLRPPAQGPHELRATVIDPAGLLLYIFQPLAS